VQGQHSHGSGHEGGEEAEGPEQCEMCAELRDSQTKRNVITKAMFEDMVRV
jgi:hypothetical protein